MTKLITVLTQTFIIIRDKPVRMAEESSRSIDSVETSIAIVEYLRDNGPARLSSIAGGVNRSNSTVHAHLQTLRDHDYVVREGERYTLGLAYLQVGGLRRQRLKVYRAGKREIDKLAEETQEASHLAVPQHGRRVILYKSEIGDAVYDNTPTGEFTNMHWTATGKAILSHLPRNAVTEIIEAHGLPRATDQTITDPDELFDHLEIVRERGYAVEREERRTGVVAVAVPIFDTREDEVVAAVSVSGPRQRLLTADEAVEQTILDTLRNRANVMELRYNHY